MTAVTRNPESTGSTLCNHSLAVGKSTQLPNGGFNSAENGLPAGLPAALVALALPAHGQSPLTCREMRD